VAVAKGGWLSCKKRGGKGKKILGDVLTGREAEKIAKS